MSANVCRQTSLRGSWRQSASIGLPLFFGPAFLLLLLSHQFEILLPRNSGSGVGPEHAMYLPCLGVRSAWAASPRNQQPIAGRIRITPAFQAAVTVVDDHHYGYARTSQPPKDGLATLAPTHPLRMGSA